MAQFRAKRLDLGCFTNIKIIRDHTKRKVFEENETERCAIPSTIQIACNPVELSLHDSVQWRKLLTSGFFRQALRYMIRNTSLPQRTRAQAQLQLSQMHCYTRPTQIRNRCIMAGKGRGVLRDFRMARVCIQCCAAHCSGKRYARSQSTEKIMIADDPNTVSISDECTGGPASRCQEGKLVEYI